VFGYANVIVEMSDYTEYIGLSGNIDRQNTACRNCLEKPPRMFLFRNLVAYDFIMFGVNAVMRHRLTEPFRLPVKTPPSVSTAMAAHAICLGSLAMQNKSRAFLSITIDQRVSIMRPAE